MQDAYVGDIGDYGKYGLLREINKTDIRLAVNWYKVVPTKAQKQLDGRYVEYLDAPEKFRHYDSVLFDELKKIVKQNERVLFLIEATCVVKADFFSEELDGNRALWHKRAMEATKNADIVFLDPDNGLETENMFARGSATEKHVKYRELKDYYDRGQSVILYQHRPQMTPNQKCIDDAVKFNREFLHADVMLMLKYPRYSTRYYILFLHENHTAQIKSVYNTILGNWNGFCEPVNI